MAARAYPRLQRMLKEGVTALLDQDAGGNVALKLPLKSVKWLSTFCRKSCLRLPILYKSFSNGFIVNTAIKALFNLLICRISTKYTNYMLSVESSQRNEVIQDFCLFILHWHSITLPQNFNEFSFCVLAYHCCAPFFGNILMRQQHDYSNKTNESMLCEIIVDVDHSVYKSSANILFTLCLKRLPVR